MKEQKKAGIEEGKNAGIKETKLEIAKNMLKKKMSIEDISEVTGLTKADIKNLKSAE